MSQNRYEIWFCTWPETSFDTPREAFKVSASKFPQTASLAGRSRSHAHLHPDYWFSVPHSFLEGHPKRRPSLDYNLHCGRLDGWNLSHPLATVTLGKVST